MSEEDAIPTLEAMYNARCSAWLSETEQRRAVIELMRNYDVMKTGWLRTDVSTKIIEELITRGYTVTNDNDGKYRVSWEHGPPVHTIKKIKF